MKLLPRAASSGPVGAAPDPSALHFQRGGRPGRNLRKKIRLRFGHVVLLLLSQAALFAGVQRLCLFLLGWDHFRLRHIEVRPADVSGRDKVERAASRFRSFNLLALDTSTVAAEIQSFSWVKEVRVRKVYPSALKVKVTVRQPLAVLDRGARFLVDEDGVLLEPADERAAGRLPLLVDAQDFQSLCSL